MLSVLGGEQGPTRGSFPAHPHLERKCLPPLATRVHSHAACARQRHVHDCQLGHHLGACRGGGVGLVVQHKSSAEFVEAACVPSFVGASSNCSELRGRDLGGRIEKKVSLFSLGSFVQEWCVDNYLAPAAIWVGWAFMDGRRFRNIEHVHNLGHRIQGSVRCV